VVWWCSLLLWSFAEVRCLIRSLILVTQWTVQNLITVLGLIVNIISGDLCVHLRKRTFTLKMSKIFSQTPKRMKKMAMVLIWNCWSSNTKRVLNLLGGGG
jgi:hypothetical protein